MTGWDDHLSNDLQCVEWLVKPYYYLLTIYNYHCSDVVYKGEGTTTGATLTTVICTGLQVAAHSA